MKATWWIIGVIVIIALAFLVFAQSETPENINENVVETDVTVEGETSSDTSDESNVVEIEVSGRNFSFTPSEIRVSEGDTVRIIFTSESGLHDWTLDEFGAATARVNGGETTSVEFVANRTGTFEYYCSVGTHRQLGMVGTFIVE